MLKNTFLFFYINVNSGADFCRDRSLQTQPKSEPILPNRPPILAVLQNSNFESYYNKNCMTNQTNQKRIVYLMAIEFVSIRSNFIKIILDII